MDIIKKLRKHGEIENELKDFYDSLSAQIEEYMCHLLDQVCFFINLIKFFSKHQYIFLHEVLQWC